MVIALDASSTCWYLARQLPDRPLHVFTNSQPICQELAKRDQITLTCSGGTLQRKYGCYVNPALISQLKSLEIDLFIFPAKASTRRARCGTPMRSMPTSNRSCLSGRRSRCC